MANPDSEMWTMFNGFEFAIGPTECGQIVVKLSPAEWEALPADVQETIVAIDILLAREWAQKNTFSANFEIREGFLCLLSSNGAESQIRKLLAPASGTPGAESLLRAKQKSRPGQRRRS